MAPSLQAVVRRMGLLPLAGRLDSAVRWVAVSELEDPTPFLEGDELLLTTGMRLESDFSEYVARLVTRGVAGLGFGVGLSHEEVPAALIRAAAEAGLPLLEVPRETPFIAIGKLVSELLAAEQYDEITRAFAAQGRLTRAALRAEGGDAVIDRLAKEIGGWAAWFDESGRLRHATRGAEAEAVTAEILRLRGLARPAEPVGAGRAGRLPASVALAGPGGHIVVRPLGGGPRPRGFFAVGAPRAFTPVTHTVVNTAGSLLTLAVERGGAQQEAERRLRDAVLSLLLSGARERARAVLAPIGRELPEEPLVVLVAGARALEALEAVAFTAREGGEVVALVEERSAGDVARLVEGAAGMSSPCGYADLRAGMDQAHRAAQVSRGQVVRFAELAGQGLVALLDPAAAQSFSAALLAPLIAYGPRADLIASLRAYLLSNGHWDAAAQRLGVHRHTLRYRMRRVAELLGRDLDDPGVRAELWFALEAGGRFGGRLGVSPPADSGRSSPS